ncbi:MAG: tetratricopeptide repeat protein [Candidatus Tokpelaia sp.]|nr:MAG: tetratricopeptide repeat protein [Candidatus Tokpelaia sp.]KAA6206729.1 MAG: tetratricopeptide repeat protein [Candidatus Tokpelaia sp.]
MGMTAIFARKRLVARQHERQIMPVKKSSCFYKALLLAGIISGLAPLWPAVLGKGLFAGTAAFAAIKSDTVSAQSFSGAYLAGSYAANQGSPYAGAYFRLALSFRPHDKIAQRELLLSLIEDGNYTQAVQTAAAMRADSDPAIRPIVQLVLAAAAFKKQHYAEVNATVGATKGDNESLLWVFFTSWADYGSGRKAKALRNLQRAHFSEWYSFLSCYNTALMQDLSRNTAGAAAAYEKALKYKQLAEMAPEAYEHLLTAYISFIQRSSGKQAAIKRLDRAQAGPGAPAPIVQTLRRRLEQGEIIPPIVNNPAQGAAEFAYDTGSTFLRAGEDLYADIYLQTALFLYPENEAALFRLGILAAKSGRREKAQAAFARIAPNSPYFDDAELLLALGLNRKLADRAKTDKKDTQAAAELEKMIARSPDKAPLQNVLANIYLQNGNYSAAINLLNTMISRLTRPEGKDWSLYFQRGIAYERSKNWPQAEENFREALRLSPQNADVLNYYGYSLTDRSIRLEEGLDMVRKAADLRPQDGAVIDSLGWAYYKLGRYDEAVTTLEKAVRLEPGESSINDHLGDAYWKIGRKLDAVFQWNHALAFNPEPEEEAAIKTKLQFGLPPAATAKTAENIAGKSDNSANPGR